MCAVSRSTGLAAAVGGGFMRSACLRLFSAEGRGRNGEGSPAPDGLGRPRSRLVAAPVEPCPTVAARPEAAGLMGGGMGQRVLSFAVRDGGGARSLPRILGFLFLGLSG